MAESVTRMLLAGHGGGGPLAHGEDVTLDVDQVLIEDATGSMACMQFEALGAERVVVDPTVLYVDHNVLQIDDRNMAEHHYLRSFCRRFGVRYSPAGNGISHYLHLERFARPGGLLVGADSHSTTAGALGMLAVGAGGLEVAVAMAGHGFDLASPRVVRVELTGTLPDWVEAKDVILELLRRHGVRGGTGAVFEFTGEGVATLSVTQRATICNMITETGATGAVFPADERTREWLAAQGRDQDWTALTADHGATYDDEEHIDLVALEPLIAVPQSPGDVVPVREVAGTPVVQVCVGSSVNSSYEDLATVAAVLAGRTVHPDVALTVTPGSRQILDTIVRGDVYRDLATAGARMLEPVCGPCIGIGQAPTRGQASVRTFNRNFPGRSGTAEDRVYLCSPSTAAATALTGHITDPRDLGAFPPLPAAPGPDPAVVDGLITEPLPAVEARRVEIVRGPSLVPPPLPEPPPAELDGRVVIVVGDDVSTGDMAPDGAIGMSVWSDIEACSHYLFRRFDPDFHDRAREWAGQGTPGIIVGGDNYGQGSSREHAAMAPLHLGIMVVAAAGFARIHRRNLVVQGIVPLLLAADADRERVSVGDRWHIAGLADAVRSGAEELTAEVDRGEPIALRLLLSRGERDVLAAGGLLRRTREGDRPPR
ncbi:aconitate hydratase [Pseudonocardia sp. RS11V-5]|uniref:aconitate hydratase n=1 Tax=Pseudonocardia terrae TaxID=2905831 RepID=UPI001E5F1E66|nr:aconitate hydratase [Pseudonocardia terrae]MCE3552028.1 aconitate hydratase [Pseudonocardia terrae]